jgi:hypothetical protein
MHLAKDTASAKAFLYSRSYDNFDNTQNQEDPKSKYFKMHVGF